VIIAAGSDHNVNGNRKPQTVLIIEMYMGMAVRSALQVILLTEKHDGDKTSHGKAHSGSGDEVLDRKIPLLSQAQLRGHHTPMLLVSSRHSFVNNAAIDVVSQRTFSNCVHVENRRLFCAYDDL
jgi:hypothetical protein